MSDQTLDVTQTAAYAALSPDEQAEYDAMDEFQRQVVDEYMNRVSVGIRPTGTVHNTAESEPEVAPPAPASAPAPSSSPAVDESAESTTQADAEAGEASQTPAPPEVTLTQPSVEAPVEAGAGEGPEGAAQPSPTFTLDGQGYTDTDLVQAVNAQKWINSLAPQQVQAIDALLSGQYQLVPIQSSPAPGSPASGAVGVVQPSPSYQPALDAEGGEWLDPQAQQSYSALQSEIAQLRAAVQSQVQSTQQSQQQHIVQAVSSATNRFAQDHSLTPDEINAITQSVQETGVFPSMAQRAGGDPEQGMYQALDMMYWTTPAFRQRAIDSQASNRLTELSEQTQADQRKHQNMTALSGSGGSAPRIDPTPAPKNKKELWAQVEAELDQAMNGNGQVS